MKWIKFFIGKIFIHWARFELQKIVLFHFLFECSSIKKPDNFIHFFHLVRIKCFASLASKWNKNTLFSFGFRFFFFSLQIFSLPVRFKIFILSSISLWILSFVSFLELSLSMIFLLCLMLLSTLCFRCSEVPGSLLFRAANLWKMPCSYCSTYYLFYAEFNRNRSNDLTKDGPPPMLVQKEKVM